jgi:oligopeptide transport system substrate-binding protein
MTRRPFWVAAVLATLPLLAGCGKQTLGDAPAGSSAPAPAATPQVFRYANFAEPQDLDPHMITGVPEFHLTTAFFEGLVQPDPKDLHPIPGLASSWEISPDGLVYTFHLRDNIRWSDGSPITADDYLLSWKRLISPKLASQYAYLIYNFVVGAKEYYDGKITDFAQVGLKKLDERTLQVTLLSPAPFLLKIIANHYAWDALPIHVVLKYGALDERSTPWTQVGHFVTSGAFMMKSWTPQVSLVAVRNPYYWDQAHVKLDEIDFFPVEDISAEERMFRAGQLDQTQQLPHGKIDTYRKEHPELLHIDPYLGVYFFRCNVKRPPLDDKRVRRALALAIDRESITRNVTRGDELPAYAVSPSNDAGYSPRARLTGTVEDAQRLLTEAGYPGGVGLPTIELLYNTSGNNRLVCEALQEMWRKNLGVKVELVNQEWKVYLDSQHTQNYQLERTGWIADYPDPHVFLEIFETGNGNNDTNWSNADYDRLLHEALSAKDEGTRYEIYQKMDAILVDECPVIPLYHYTRPYLMRTQVKGSSPNALDNPFFKGIYIQE